MSAPQLTKRQARDWPGAIARLRVHYPPLPEDIRNWTVDYAEEARPGRGHFVSATYLDGEIFAQVMMDVHGYPSVYIAQLDWIHSDANEECDCEPCLTEAKQENEA
jgi:hypothetical protein